MFKLLVIIFTTKLYARKDIFKNCFLLYLKRQLKKFVNEKWQNVKKISSHSTGEIF